MSERDRRQPHRDYPIAQGVAPPPGWFRPQPRGDYPSARPAAVPPSGSLVPSVEPAASFAFAVDPQLPLRPPSRGRSFGWLRQLAIVVVLVGSNMAAGWWLFQGRAIRATTAAPAVAPEIAQGHPMWEAAAQVATVATDSTPRPTPPPKASDAPPPDKGPDRLTPSNQPLSSTPPTATLTFQKDILPIFQAKCVTCHGANDKRKGGLDLRTAAALHQGGESGPVIVRGNPENSLLWETVANDQMPPNKNKLSSSEKAKVRQWIASGQ